MNAADKKELLIRCWKTSRGTWLYYCHLIGTGGAGKLDAAAPGHMGMRLIDKIEDLESVLKEILISIKKASPEFPQGSNITDYTEDDKPKRAADFRAEHDRILPQNSEIPAAKRDRSFCTHISIIERLFSASSVGYSTTPSCADCAVKKDEECLKEYRFSTAYSSGKDISCSGFHRIDLKGVRCPIQTDPSVFKSTD